jgi:plastocyanin
MDQDPKCREMNPRGALNDDLRVERGHVADVFVYVKNVLWNGTAPPSTPVVLDQRGCMYAPKVFGIVVGQPLEIVNSDPTLHNIHAMARKGEFNVGMPTQGQHVTKVFKKAEGAVPIKCDVHPWMHAIAWTMDHPFFAVTDSNGLAAITGLAPGEYDLVASHARLGELSAHVSLPENASQNVFLRFAVP